MIFYRYRFAIFSIAIIATIGFLYLSQSNSDQHKDVANAETNNNDDTLKSDSNNENSNGKPTSNASNLVVGSFEKIKIDENILNKNFSKSIEEAGRCLNLSVNSDSENIESTSESLANVLRPDMGDVVMKNEEKVESYFQSSNGEKRKLRLEMDYSRQNAVVRKLTYSTQQEQSEWVEQELTQEQSEDPSESFISSLMNDGDLYYEEKVAKLYFQNGEDISYFSSDGRILSYEFYHEGKKFSCKDLHSESSKCICQ